MTGARHLLVLEPQPSLSLFLAEQIEGWRVRQISGIEEVPPALPVAALLLADAGDHAALAAYVRLHHMIGPIFSLVEQDREVSPPLVALAKPVRLNVLMAKLEAPNGSAVDRAPIGEWMVDAAQRSLIPLTAAAAPERLTDKEFEVLSLLLMASPQPIAREQLQNEIWRYHADVSTHTVETHIWRLRQKLETDPSNPALLLTEAEGYRLLRR